MNPFNLYGGFKPPCGSGRSLPFGQTVDHVVMHDIDDPGVSSDRRHEVVSPFAVHIAISSFGDDR